MNDFNYEAVGACEAPLDFYLMVQYEDFIKKVVEDSSRRNTIQVGQESKLQMQTVFNMYCT